YGQIHALPVAWSGLQSQWYIELKAQKSALLLLLLRLDPAQNMVHPSESLQAKLRWYARYINVAADHLTNLFPADSNGLLLLPTNLLYASYLLQFLQDRTCHVPNH